MILGIETVNSICVPERENEQRSDRCGRLGRRTAVDLILKLNNGDDKGNKAVVCI